MGIYLNPSKDGFIESISSQIYVDKSGMIAELNAVPGSRQKHVCVSRPRRFGKTMAADMISGMGTASKALTTLVQQHQAARITGVPHPRLGG